MHPSPFPKPPSPFSIRPFWRSDFEQLLRIDRVSFKNPWGRREFEAALHAKDVTMLVAHKHLALFGFIVMQLWPKHVSIWNMAVEPEQRRRGVGAALVDRAKALGLGKGRELLKVDVREHDLASQLFFKAQGFRAVHLEKETCIADPAIAFEFHRLPDGVDVLKSILEGDGRTIAKEVA